MFQPSRPKLDPKMSFDRSYETLVCDTRDQLLIVTLNRPERANALNTQMGRDLLAVFDALLLDPEAMRCVILTGSGTRAFCAGGDLKERNGMPDAVWRSQHAVFEQAFYRLMDCPVPVIAAVNGAAYGGGCELALACDFIFAAEHARFAQTETALGIIPGGGGTQTLARAVGTRRASELILSATPFSATEAVQWGMVNRVFPSDELMPRTLEVAARIAANGPIAVRQAKRAVRVGSEVDLKTGLAIEIEAYNRTVSSADRREGIAAASEGRKPSFRGE
jgi:enoyl-CoA hydratase/carnithine racemase